MNCELRNAIDARSAALPPYPPVSPYTLREPQPAPRPAGPPISLPPMTLPAYIDCELGNICICHGIMPMPMPPMPMFIPKPGPMPIPPPTPPPNAVVADEPRRYSLSIEVLEVERHVPSEVRVHLHSIPEEEALAAEEAARTEEQEETR